LSWLDLTVKISDGFTLSQALFFLTASFFQASANEVITGVPRRLKMPMPLAMF
jgi:hypothetical protein